MIVDRPSGARSEANATIFAEQGRRTVLVTGANGFIGRHVVGLLRDRGETRVIATGREARDGASQLDLRRADRVERALQGVEVLVHCAAGDRRESVAWTAALLAAARGAGVRRVVHLSSVAVYGTAQGLVGEETPMTASARGYAAFKADAERACLEAEGLAAQGLAATGLEIVRLRPSLVYGAGSVAFVEHSARRIRSGRWGTLGAAGEGTCNLVHVSDVARAVAAAVDARAVGAFNIDGPETPSWNEWFERLALAMGAPPLVPIDPARLGRRAIYALPIKAIARGRPGFMERWRLGAPSRGELALYARTTYYPIDAAARLGWRPAIGLSEGMAECAAWLRTRGLAR